MRTVDMEAGKRQRPQVVRPAGSLALGNLNFCRLP